MQSSSLSRLTALELKYDGAIPADLLAEARRDTSGTMTRLQLLRNAARAHVRSRREHLEAGNVSLYRSITRDGNALCATLKREREAARRVAEAA